MARRWNDDGWSCLREAVGAHRGLPLCLPAESRAGHTLPSLGGKFFEKTFTMSKVKSFWGESPPFGFKISKSKVPMRCGSRTGTRKSEEGFVVTQTPGKPIPKMVLVPRNLPASSPSPFHVNKEHLDQALQTDWVLVVSREIWQFFSSSGQYRLQLRPWHLHGDVNFKSLTTQVGSPHLMLWQRGYHQVITDENQGHVAGTNFSSAACETSLVCLALCCLLLNQRESLVSLSRRQNLCFSKGVCCPTW